MQPLPTIHQQPINWLQRIALYVTKSKYYLVGSNNTQTAFKVLKIDRTSLDLELVDDGIEYSYDEIRDLLIRIDLGNRTATQSKGVEKTVSSFGLVGFVKFLHGYYLILITKRRRVASIGYHSIFKVEETKLVYIPNQSPTSNQSIEARYVKAFNNVDLTRNFYFSYSYDLTHSLQYNLLPVRPYRFRSYFSNNCDDQERDESQTQNDSETRKIATKPSHILIKSKPCYRFTWNHHLINIDDLHDDWKLHLIHGFVEQANICVYSRSIYITLIARRSRLYSGTRFLKRGLNLDGDVANEVETEQIVHDSSISSFTKGYYTSFVQMRGSLPDRWSQNPTKIVPKPQITRDFVDPYHQAPAKHFENLLKRYGSPIVVLNLVKRKEKKVHESILDTMLVESVSYLNQFLPSQHIIRHIAFDMARCNKSRGENVMQRLGKIGFNILRVTGIFQSWPKPRRSTIDNSYMLLLRQRTFNRMPSSSRIGGFRLVNGKCLQNGVVRVNCVDSLDRTNTAQFVLGKVALAFQLQALGVLVEPSLEYDTDAVRLLEQLYEAHGDTIALQYGGSQLVHRVKTYRKISPLSSHSSEIMQTLSRYYSNTFSDSEKQNLINIFLGIRKPSVTDPWNMVSDYYLHNRVLLEPFKLRDQSLSYTRWYDTNMIRCLPRAQDQFSKETNCYMIKISPTQPIDERIDCFKEAYRPYEMTCLSTVFHSQMLHTIRDFMPSDSMDISPFSLRLKPGKFKEKYLNSSLQETITSSKQENSDRTSDLSMIDSDDDDNDNNDDDDQNSTNSSIDNSRAIMSRSDASYASMSRRRPSIRSAIGLQQHQQDESNFKFDNPIDIACDGVNQDDFDIYSRYIEIGNLAGEFKSSPKQNDSHFDTKNLISEFQCLTDVSEVVINPLSSIGMKSLINYYIN